MQLLSTPVTGKVMNEAGWRKVMDTLAVRLNAASPDSVGW